MSKKYDTVAALAAAAAGVGAPAGGEVPPEAPTMSGAGVSQEGQQESVPAPKVDTDSPEEEDACQEVKAQLADATQKVTVLTAQYDLMKSQLAEKEEALVAAKLEAATYASVPELRKIVAQVIDNMQVALGGASDPALPTMDAAALVERHTAVHAKFIEQFKVGGVGSAAGAAESAQKPSVSRKEAASIRMLPRRKA